MRGSSLQRIPGVGEKRSRELLRTFGSLSAIRDADLETLKRSLPEPTAKAVYDYFHTEEETP